VRAFRVLLDFGLLPVDELGLADQQAPLRAVRAGGIGTTQGLRVAELLRHVALDVLAHHALEGACGELGARLCRAGDRTLDGNELANVAAAQLAQPLREEGGRRVGKKTGGECIKTGTVPPSTQGERGVGEKEGENGSVRLGQGCEVGHRKMDIFRLVSRLLEEVGDMIRQKLDVGLAQLVGPPGHNSGDDDMLDEWFSTLKILPPSAMPFFGRIASDLGNRVNMQAIAVLTVHLWNIRMYTASKNYK